MEDEIDAMVAEAFSDNANEQPAPEEAAIESSEEVTGEVEAEVVTEEDAEPKQEDREEDLRNKPDSELTPQQLAKREQNRRSHTNSKLARLARENRELRARMEAAAEPTTQEPQAPNMDDFDTLEAFMDARDAYRDSKQLAAQPKSQPQIDPVQAQRAQQVMANEAEFVKTTPEYAQLVGENAEFFDEVAADPKLQNAIMEADNAPMALYALMKEGLIGELYQLSPTRLAAELAKAEIRGQSYLVPKKTVTSAPAPIASAKGTGVYKKQLSEMSADDIVDKWLK